MILYGFPASGNTQKVRMALRLVGADYDEFALTGGAHKQPDFLALNPLGQVPVLVDANVTIRDSQAILVYLAEKFPSSDISGRNAAERAHIAQWLSFAANEIAAGPALLRKSLLFGTTIDRPIAEETCTKVMTTLAANLSHSGWLEGDRITIADLACSPYIALAHQGGVNLSAHHALQTWIDRIGRQQWFPEMLGWPPSPSRVAITSAASQV